MNMNMNKSNEYCQPQPQPPVFVAVDRLVTASDRLDGNLVSLGETLLPILSSLESGKDCDMEVSVGSSDLTVRLNRIAAGLEGLAEYVVSLRARVEI